MLRQMLGYVHVIIWSGCLFGVWDLAGVEYLQVVLISSRSIQADWEDLFEDLFEELGKSLAHVTNDYLGRSSHLVTG
jgi:hypothetical protein